MYLVLALSLLRSGRLSGLCCLHSAVGKLFVSQGAEFGAVCLAFRCDLAHVRENVKQRVVCEYVCFYLLLPHCCWSALCRRSGAHALLAAVCTTSCDIRPVGVLFLTRLVFYLNCLVSVLGQMDRNVKVTNGEMVEEVILLLIFTGVLVCGSLSLSFMPQFV